MPEAIIGRKLGPEPVNYGLGNGFRPELPLQLSVGGAHNMTVSWRWRLRDIPAQVG